MANDGKMDGNAGQGGRSPLGNGFGATGGSGQRPTDFVANPRGDADPGEGHDYIDRPQGTPGSAGKPRDFSDSAAQPMRSDVGGSRDPRSIPRGGIVATADPPASRAPVADQVRNPGPKPFKLK